MSINITQLSNNPIIIGISPYSISINQDNENENNCTERQKRKRQRLDHMTLEEKLMRRKLKNRVSAQSARDRRKDKMKQINDRILLLKNSRNAIQKENETLRLKNEQLMNENTELKKRIANEEADLVIDNAIASHWKGSVETAELINVPQLKEQESTPMCGVRSHVLHSMMQFACLLMMKNLITLMICYKNSPKNFLNPPSVVEMKNYKMMSAVMNQWLSLTNNKWNRSET